MHVYFAKITREHTNSYIKYNILKAQIKPFHLFIMKKITSL